MDFVELEKRWQEENPDGVARNEDGSLEEHYGYLRKWLASEGYPLEDQPNIGEYILKPGDVFVCWNHDPLRVLDDAGTVISVGFGGPSAMGPSAQDLGENGEWKKHDGQYIIFECWSCYLEIEGEEFGSEDKE